MQIINNLKVKEQLYVEKLKNGLTVMIIPKKNTNKKYAIIGTEFGSIDNNFLVPGENKEVNIPDGVAHFLEHKLFEQENGKNSLDVLSALGVEANAYTTNNHTAYLFECVENFNEAFDELMDYVQNPYFTDENIEKEKGIINQEISMYDDDPQTQVYMNSLKCLYHNNPVKIDIAGTIESVSEINKDILYNCYNTFYNPSNMSLVLCGDFNPENIIEEIKNRLVDKEAQGEIKRIYPEEKKEIKKEKIETEMEVSNPLFVIGIKDEVSSNKEIVKKHIAIEILLHIIFGKSSQLYKELYENGDLIINPDLDYEFAKNYAHIMITGQSKDPEKVYDRFKEEIEKYKKEGIDKKHFERISKMIYGYYIISYNNVGMISRMFLSDYFKGINSFEYIEQFDLVTLEYIEEILKEVFVEDKMIISIVKNKKD